MSEGTSTIPVSTSDVQKLTPELISQLRRKAEENFYFFAKGILGFPWIEKSVHKPLCDILQDYENNKHLKVVLPRGWLKTTICSCSFPLWRALRQPNLRILIVQNTFLNACKKLSRIGGLVKQNDLVRLLWPELMPDSGCTWKSEAMCLKRPGVYDEATFEAAGTGTQVTGRHYDMIIEDDTVAPDCDDMDTETMAPSADDINKAIGWHRLATPLLNNPSRDQRLVVGTRWAEKDLLSWIDQNEPSYRTYQRAAREDIAGNASDEGEPAYVSRFDADALDSIKAALGPYMYSALYMNSPLSSSSMTFQPDWIKYYETAERDMAIYTTVDLAGNPDDIKSRDSDFNVVITTGKSLKTGNIFVLDLWRQRANPGEVISEIFAQARKWHPLRVGIESVAYQGTINYWLRERMIEQKFHFYIDAITGGRKSKDAKILGLQPLFAAGKIFIRAHMGALVQELLAYPLGAHDDVIDTLSMQIRMWQATRSNKEVLAEERAQTNALSLDSALKELSSRGAMVSFPFVRAMR